MLKFDFHLHTVASGHAYNTILEIAKDASEKGLEAIAITDHGPLVLPDCEGYKYYFSNINCVPEKLFDVRVLKGCEANINPDGTLDLPSTDQTKLDIVLAGLHTVSMPPGLGRAANTAAIIKAMAQNRIHIISHPYLPLYPVDLEAVMAAGLKYRVLLEINLSVIRRNLKNEAFIADVKRVIDWTIANKTKIVINSDAHFITWLGDDSILAELPFKIPTEIIFGSSGYQEVEEFLKSK